MHPLRLKTPSRLAIAVLAGTLALSLAACGDKKEGELPKGEPIAAIAPPAGKMWSDVVSATADGGMQMGNPDAPIKLVEYGSLSCPHCARLAKEGMRPLVEKYVGSGRVSYEFRSYAIHGIIDLPMTVLVRCASPDAFFPLVEQIYSDQDAIVDRAEKGNDQAQKAANLPANQRWVALSDAFGLTDWFAARGLSVDQAHACLANAESAQKVADQTQVWFKAGINSTPSLMINGGRVELPAGEEPWPALEVALQNAGAR
jgi:protein-disulfide isomerase